MKIFKVESDNVAYDEDISMIIMAENELRALELAKKNWCFRQSRSHNNFRVAKIDDSSEQIVEVSHYGS